MSFLEFDLRLNMPNVGDAVDAVVDEVLHDVVTEARSSMEQIPTGRTYKRYGRIHVASAPHRPPAIDTGALYSSLTSFRTGSGGVVMASTEYAGYLEFGTRKMEPRPFMEPAAQEARRRKPYYEYEFVRRVE